MSQAISSLWALPITADAPVACDRTKRKDFPDCLREGWMEGWRMGKMEDEMSDASPSTVLFFFLSTMGSFGPVLVLVTHSLIHSPSQLCKRILGSLRPLHTLCPSSSYWEFSLICYFPAISFNETICLSLSSPLSLSLSVWEQTLIHTRTHTLWLTSACSASVSVSISTLPPLRLSLSLLQCLCRLDHVFSRKKNLANQSPQLIPPPIASSLSLSLHPSLCFTLTLCLKQRTDASAHTCVLSLYSFWIILTHWAHGPRRHYKQPGERCSTNTYCTIQIMMLKGWQLACDVLLKMVCKTGVRGSRIVGLQ